MSDENSLTKPADTEMGDPLDAVDADLFEKLKPKQIKYAQMSVVTNLSPDEMARHLGVSRQMIGRWSKNKDVKRFINQYQQYIFKHEANQARMQKKMLKDKAFAEVMRRYSAPPEITDDTPYEEVKDIKSQYAAYAPFKEAVQALQIVDKISGDENVAAGEDEFVEGVRRRYHRIKVQKRKMQEALEQSGLGGKSYRDLVTENGVDFFAPEGVSQNLEDYEVVQEMEEIEQISILKREDNE